MFDSLLWQQFFTQFHFIRPWWLICFIPFGVIIFLRWRFDTKSELSDIIPQHLREVLTIGEQGWKKQLPLKLLAVCTALGIIVCAGPSWQREASPFGEDKAAMVVVLDNSQSMLEKDLPPSRLERSKQKIRDLLNLRAGGKTGLVVYAGSAHTAMPLTQDSAVFAPFLAAITPDIMPTAGKFAEKTLPVIDNLLNGSPGGTVLLVTDGVTPKAIDAYGEFFKDKPYQLLILAAGNPDIATNNPIDMKSLNQLADKTDGRVITTTVDDSDLKTLNNAIERNMQINGESAMPWKDMSHPFIIVMAVLMLFWFRKGWLVQWCLIGAFTIGMTPHQAQASVYLKAETKTKVVEISTWDKVTQVWMDLWLTPDQQGQRQFNKLNYLEAAKHFEDPMRKGIAYYYAAEYKLAQSEFVEADSDLGLYYAASALARQREYVAARSLLRQLDKKADLSPELRKNVEHNLKVILGIVDDVNRMSKSQTGTADGPGNSRELNDEPQTGDGAEEQASAEETVKQNMTAEQILGSDELANKWLKKVDADPKFFLSRKFMLQLQQDVPGKGSLSQSSPENGTSNSQSNLPKTQEVQ
ncbi:VWA domain-containing protein [Vibrio rumoiensis]|uniref:VWFA domain-containing protein n=1 Tax=Vibrio rumoiensis 1S-45 TaxID=1188252 RepID=A0A1E5E2C5_9VIBR|nr:VWA domain-containing protein [Vibrio rumoiensis]OEF25581.1 hypothetical protein A1QC_01490 [Vibrio rumoiensis 1S-45]